MNWLFPLALLTGCSLQAADAGTSTSVDVPTESKRWSSFLPLMSEEAIKKGYELPLPFGVSAIYNYIQRDIEVSDLRIGPAGSPPQSVSRFVDLGSDSQVNVALTRL